MKKTIALLCAILMLLTACDKSPKEVTTTPSETTSQVETTTPTDENEDETEEIPKSNTPINTMERMTEAEGVLSVEKQEFEANIKQVVAYKMVYESEYGKLGADVILPEDYTNPYKHCSVLIYYPDVGLGIEDLALAYALQDVIVVRPYLRGKGESEGMYDFGGDKDIADAKALLKILDCATFVQNSNIYIAGAANFSIHAFRLLAEDSENRISGCAVTNPITNLSSFYEMEEQNVKTYISNLIGKTLEEAPEEYEKRSAVRFADKLIGKPIFILRNLKWPRPAEQINHFVDLLEKDDYEYHRLNLYTTDFVAVGNDDGRDLLLSWINEQDQKSKELKIEEDERSYFVRTEWMKFHFSKLDYQKEDVMPIVVEAVALMADVRDYLGVDYTIGDAQGAICYFNSQFNDTVDGRFYHYYQRIMCRNLSVFVHEYAHMVSISSSDCLYTPQKLFVEGLATYVQYTFHHATSQEYQYFQEDQIYEWGEPHHQYICDIIEQGGVEYNAENYKKATIVMMEIYWGGYSEERLDYPYEIGQIFVEYCVEELGGMQKFMRAFGDYLKFEDVYGKTVEEVVKEAREWNMAQFGIE